MTNQNTGLTLFIIAYCLGFLILCYVVYKLAKGLERQGKAHDKLIKILMDQNFENAKSFIEDNKNRSDLTEEGKRKLEKAKLIVEQTEKRYQKCPQKS